LGEESEMEYTVEEFCRAVLSEMVEAHGKQDLHFDDERTSAALRAVISKVWDAAKVAYESKQEDRAAVLVEWLDAISPNPNTGSFDGFWQTLRALQPLDLGIKNPRYVRVDATLDHLYRRATLEAVPDEWRELVRESGALLRQAA
jgi:hypothetical protein